MQLNKFRPSCFSKSLTKMEVATKIIEIDEQLEIQLERFEDVSKTEDYFNGTVFAVFNDSYDYESYKEQFPQSFTGRMLRHLNYFLCGCCYDKSKLELLKQTLSFTVNISPEPSDIKWENLDISNAERFKRKLKVLILMFFILILSLGALLGLSYLQIYIKDNKTESTKDSVGYVLSSVFACTTTLLNYLIVQLIVKLTQYEKHISQSQFVFYLSIKLFIFTFLNSSLLTVIVSVISGDWGQHRRVLVSNVFFIFLINSIYYPMYFLIGPLNIWKTCKRNKIIRKFNESGSLDLDEDMTQKELNT